MLTYLGNTSPSKKNEARNVGGPEQQYWGCLERERESVFALRESCVGGLIKQ